MSTKETWKLEKPGKRPPGRPKGYVVAEETKTEIRRIWDAGLQARYVLEPLGLWKDDNARREAIATLPENSNGKP